VVATILNKNMHVPPLDTTWKSHMTPELLTLLKRVDTPTVCNAIEVVDGKRGFNQFTRGTVLCSDPQAGAVVGYARTAKISAVAPSTESPDVVRSKRMAYYKYMADAPQPAATVIQDVDVPHAIGAYWGEINTNIHKGFGIAGVLTNGVMRDLGDLPSDFPVIAGSIGPSHGFVHVLEMDTAVTVFDLTVHPGDLLHADRHGAVVIPHTHIVEMVKAIAQLISTERIVLDAAQSPGFDFEKFEAAWRSFEAARV
jgi:regulator of RNase E activity RraA